MLKHFTAILPYIAAFTGTTSRVGGLVASIQGYGWVEFLDRLVTDGLIST